MATNKYIFEALEKEIGFAHNGIQKLELITISKLVESMSLAQGSTSVKNQKVYSHSISTNDSSRSFTSKLTKIEFPKSARGDPTVCYNKPLNVVVS